jgi:pimeloyl-ACP methyl ester carboxylesterase
MPTIDILGVPHTYELTPPVANSSAPVLIFIHGWLLSRNYWQPLTDKLSTQYQCLTYDLRGFGDSQPIPKTETSPSDNAVLSKSSASSSNGSTPSQYSLAAYANDLSILLQKLDICSAWLIGHSLGGSIALWGAKCCSDIVQGVICLNAGGGIYLKEEFERFRSAGQQMIQLRPPWLSSVPLIDRVFARVMVARPLSRDWGRQRAIDFVKADAQAALGALLDTTTETEVHLLPQIVAHLKQPVYFLAGEKDRVMELKYVRHLASFHQLFELSGNNVIAIPDCGHLSMVECPDFIATQISFLLQEHSAH